MALNCYDRLVRFKRVKVDDGTTSFDINALEPELAESWQEASDGTSSRSKFGQMPVFIAVAASPPPT